MCHNGFWHKMTQPKLNNDISLFSLGWVIHLCHVLIKKMHPSKPCGAMVSGHVIFLLHSFFKNHAKQREPLVLSVLHSFLILSLQKIE